MIQSIRISNQFNNGKLYEIGSKFKVLVNGKCRSYKVVEIKDSSLVFEDNVYSEFQIMVETENKTVVLWSRLINCSVVINEIH